MKHFIPFLALLALTFNVMGESVELSSGEILDGRLIEFPKDVTIELADGSKRTVPYEKIASIFKSSTPKPFTPSLKESESVIDAPPQDPNDTAFPSQPSDQESPFSTPLRTFETWKNAALQANIEAMSQCYAKYRQKDVKKDLKKISKTKRDEMRRAMAETIFTPSEPFYQGELAILEVTWTKGLASQTQSLKFTLESGKEWKILE